MLSFPLFYGINEIKKINHNKKQPIISFTQSDNKHKQNYDAIVICAGVNSKFLANDLGDNVNIYPVKGYSITLLLICKISPPVRADFPNICPRISTLGIVAIPYGA